LTYFIEEKMKKFILAFALVSSSAFAKTDVSVVWPFALSTSAVAQVREIVAQANQGQSKYNFVFENRPGAGGAIAAAHVLKSDRPAVLVSAASFFVAPHLSTQKLYSVDQFAMLNAYCTDQPVLLLSKRYRNLKEVAGNNDVTVGLMPGFMQVSLNEINTQIAGATKFRAVTYKTMDQLTVGVTGKHVNASIGWMSTAKVNDLYVLGLSGRQSYNGWPTFESQGIKGLDTVTQSYYFFANTAMPEDTKKELAEILGKATMTPKSVALCEADFGRANGDAYPKTNAIMTERTNFWKQRSDAYTKSITATK